MLLLVIVYLPGGIVDPRRWRACVTGVGKQGNGDRRSIDGRYRVDLQPTFPKQSGTPRGWVGHDQLLVEDLTQQFAGLTALHR